VLSHSHSTHDTYSDIYIYNGKYMHLTLSQLVSLIASHLVCFAIRNI